MFLQSTKMAMNAVLSNKLRSFLTMLGIIIGVFTLVVLVSLVNGVTGAVTDTISSLGGSYLTVSVSDDKGKPIRMEDLEAFMDEEAIGYAAPLAQLSVTGKVGHESGSVTLYGTTPAYMPVNSLNIRYGRFLTQSDVDNHNYVAVINETMAKDLLGSLNCLGQTVSLDGVHFTVVGILEDDEDSMTSMFISGLKMAYVPYTTAQRLADSVSSSLKSFYIAAPLGGTAEAAKARMETLLLNRFSQDEEAFSISDNSSIEDAMSSVTSMLEYLLGGIAAISLLVGGIGIMNIMLVSVTERTKEIGIRKAIGADRKDILLQFLIEALVISLLGCLLGLVLSWVALHIISFFVSDVSFGVSGGVAALSVVFSTAIGLLFGLYPANKAAAKPPIEALRFGQ